MAKAKRDGLRKVVAKIRERHAIVSKMKRKENDFYWNEQPFVNALAILKLLSDPEDVEFKKDAVVVIRETKRVRFELVVTADGFFLNEKDVIT